MIRPLIWNNSNFSTLLLIQPIGRHERSYQCFVDTNDSLQCVCNSGNDYDNWHRTIHWIMLFQHISDIFVSWNGEENNEETIHRRRFSSTDFPKWTKFKFNGRVSKANQNLATEISHPSLNISHSDRKAINANILCFTDLALKNSNYECEETVKQSNFWTAQK